MAVRMSALRAGRPLPPRKIPGTHLCQRLSRPQGHSAAGRIRSIEKIHLIGSHTRDLPACSLVSQPTTLSRNPLNLPMLFQNWGPAKDIIQLSPRNNLAEDIHLPVQETGLIKEGSRPWTGSPECDPSVPPRNRVLKGQMTRNLMIISDTF
jgi:hypothetical protein